MKRLLLALLALALPFSPLHGATRPEEMPGGFVVCLGQGKHKEAVALARSGRHCVHWLVEDEKSVHEQRHRLHEAGLAGRLVIDVLAPRLPYPDRFVDGLLADLDRLGKAAPSRSEIRRVLSPRGWTLLGHGGKESRLVGEKDRRIDEWTHAWYGPAGNPVSQDEIAGVPTAVQWAAGPSFADGAIGGKLPRIGGGTFLAVDSVDGALVARSAGSGVLLWRRASALMPTADLAVVAGRVYLHHPDGKGTTRNRQETGPLVALDLRTGDPVQTYDKGLQPDSRPGARQPGFPQFLVEGETIVQAVGSELTVLDRVTGARRWTRMLKDGTWFSPILLGDLVVAVECTIPPRRARLTNSPEAIALSAFALADGKPRWRLTELLPKAEDVKGRDGRTTPMRPGLAPIVGDDGLILLHGGSYQSRSPNAFIAAVSAREGKELWRHTIPDKVWTNTIESSRLIKRGEVVYYLGGRGIRAFDARTGKARTEFLKRPRYAFNGFGECSGSRASARWLLVNGLCFWDEKLNLVETWGARSSCGTGLIPANGMVYALPTGCDCRSYSRGYLGLSCTPLPTPVADDQRLKRGPAYGKVRPAAKASSVSGWPIFLGNAGRTGVAADALPTRLATRWRVRLTHPQLEGVLGKDRSSDERYLGETTAVTMAAGLVLAACPERHQVVALEAATGKLRWRFQAGGVVDAPPTVHGEVAYFGCHAGRIHAVRLSDGALVWSFLAAPVEQKAMLHGHLASAFPVRGSVLVLDGKVLATAGFHTDLGGIHVWSLDPVSGKVMGKSVLAGGRAGQPPAVNDILSVNAKGDQAWLFTDAAVTADARAITLPWKRHPRDETGPLVALDRAGAFVRFRHDRRGGSTHGWKGAMRAGNVAGHRVVRDGKRAYVLCDPTEAERHPVRANKTRVLRAVDLADRNDVWSASSQALGSKTSYSALVKAGNRLILGGGEDREGFVQIVAADSGKRLSEYRMPARVTECGLAVADGRLFVSCEDGSVLCLGE